MTKRSENERKFEHWTDNPDGTRTYWYEVTGKGGWIARYIKIVDANEQTISFRQEIYDEKNQLIEIHEKYPIDKEHQKL